MKKKLIAMLALLSCVAFSGTMLAACKDEPTPDEPTHTVHVDADGDGKCDECGADMGGEETPEVKMTDGVYSRQMDSSHETLIKLYEDGTAYLAGFTVSYKGWYEVKEESISTANCADDGTIIDAAAEADGKGEHKWLTFDTAIYFWADEDMTQPITVNASAESEDALPSSGVGYAYGTPENALAYDAENDLIYNYKFDQATRTLSHSSLRDFDEDDENAIEKYKFMLKNEADIPADAEEGATVQDYTLTITQKGFEGNLLGGSAVWNGKYTVEGNVYTLNDTFSGEDVGTLTISADGTTATYTNGDVTIELVQYAAAVDLPVATMEGTVTRDMQGEETQFEFTLSFYGDFTGKVVVSAFGMEMDVTTFGWKMAEDGRSVVISDVSNGELTNVAPTSDYQNVEATWKGDVNASLSGIEVTLSAPAAALSALKDVVSVATPVYTFTGSFVSGKVNLSCVLYDDGTVVLSGNGGTVVDEGTWARGAGFPTVTFEKGTATVSGTSATDVKLTYVGNIGMGENTYELTLAPEEPEVLGTLTGGGGSFVMTLSLYDDHTCAITMGETQITTGTWSFANYALTVTLEGQEPATSDTSVLQTEGIVVSLVVGSSGTAISFTGPNTLVGVLG